MDNKEITGIERVFSEWLQSEELKLFILEFNRACVKLFEWLDTTVSRMAEWVADLHDVIARIAAALRSELPPPWARKKRDRKGPHFARSQNVHLPPPMWVAWQPCGRRG